MAEESTGGHGESRLDRMEKLMEIHIREHRILNDDIGRFVDRVVRGDEEREND